MQTLSQLQLDLPREATYNPSFPVFPTPSPWDMSIGSSYDTTRYYPQDCGIVVQPYLTPSLCSDPVPGGVIVVITDSSANSVHNAPYVVRRLWTAPEQIAQGTSATSRMKATLSSLRVLCQHGDIDGAVDRCFEVIENALACLNLDSVDELLENAEPECLDPRITIGMLRATSRVRDKLQAWIPLLLKEQARLQRDGRDEKRMLRGLLPVNANITYSGQITAA